MVKTTGKYSHKLYKCERCGHEQQIGTNHWGAVYSSCPKCQWKHPMEIGSTWECLEPMPEGYEKPEPWKKVTLGEVMEIHTITRCIDCGQKIYNRAGEKKQQMCPKHLRLLHADLTDQ